MHSARALLDPAHDAVEGLARRGFTLDAAALNDLVSRKNAAVKMVDDLRAEANSLAAQIGRQARANPTDADVADLRQRAVQVKRDIVGAQHERMVLEGALLEQLLTIPNLPADDVPDGKDESANVEVRRCGTVPAFDFPVRDHVDLGEAMGILDFARAAKMSGARFALARGTGAVLERALATLFLTMHTTQHGYEELSVPTLVNRETMAGTGQLPKFEDDLFKTFVGDRELFLIPTAEVPVTNMHAGETLEAAHLPLAYTAWTPCFRSEAGSHGRDTRGLLRLHEFAKVEMVRICDPADSRAQLELMVGHAEACLQALGLAYRVVKLAAGDLGFSAQVTYDLEVWLPSQSAYREISSCSDTGTFQAQRANIRLKHADGRRGLAATLNGSGLPIGRTMAALLEQGQQEDGSVALPAALVPYAGFRAIAADGSVVR